MRVEESLGVVSKVSRSCLRLLQKRVANLTRERSRSDQGPHNVGVVKTEVRPEHSPSVVHDLTSRKESAEPLQTALARMLRNGRQHGNS